MSLEEMVHVVHTVKSVIADNLASKIAAPA
jgi:hypothetical protein